MASIATPIDGEFFFDYVGIASSLSNLSVAITFSVLIIYVCFLAERLWAVRILKSALQDGRFVVVQGLSAHSTPLGAVSRPHLDQVLRSLQETEPARPPPRAKLPCALSVLKLRDDGEEALVRVYIRTGPFALGVGTNFTNVYGLSEDSPTPMRASVHYNCEYRDPRALSEIADASGDASGTSVELIPTPENPELFQTKISLSPDVVNFAFRLRSGSLSATWVVRRESTELSLAKHIVSTPTGLYHELQEMYGLEDVEDQDCVVCLSELKEVSLLPCRHLCVCKACLPQIGDKCPVCRTRFNTHVSFELGKRGSAAAAAQADAEKKVKTKKPTT